MVQQDISQLLQAGEQLLGERLAAARQTMNRELATVLGVLALCLVVVALLFALRSAAGWSGPAAAAGRLPAARCPRVRPSCWPRGASATSWRTSSRATNRLIQRLQQDQQQKAGQLSSVSSSLQEMVAQVQEIHHSTRTTEQAVDESDTMMQELNQLASEVHQVAAEIAQHAQHNEHSMTRASSWWGAC